VGPYENELLGQGGKTGAPTKKKETKRTKGETDKGGSSNLRVRLQDPTDEDSLKKKQPWHVGSETSGETWGEVGRI